MRPSLFFYTVFFIVSLLVASSGSAGEKGPSSFALNSSAFQNGGEIGRKYTCDGEDVSPALTWSNIPPGTKSLALIADDPDAPGGTWVHWVIYDIPHEVNELGEATAKSETVSGGTKQGVNDFRRLGYSGPCPPPGAPHRYYFKLYALDAPMTLKARATKQQVVDAMKGHILGEAELMGRYKR